MSSPISKTHHTLSTSFDVRASLPNTSPLAAYLLHLIAIKRSNLCLSADVNTTAELLEVAEEVGDSICLLKTHADIINDFSEKTVRELREIAKRKRFLVFEDRKFGDIGSTVQKQYTQGPLSIAKWAEITNAHIFPGPAIVTSLKQAAASAIASYNSSVNTEISVGSPSSDNSSEDEPSPVNGVAPSHGVDRLHTSTRDLRKSSVVSISTTISTKTEPISPVPTPYIDDGSGSASSAFENLGSTPYLRALLLLAEMSSEGNLLTGEYTTQCVEIARQHNDFVIGFIAQRSLNEQESDNFLTMTPGVSLPPPGKENANMGDGQGQQYNTPRHVVLEMGSDVIIVGRGILQAEDRAAEAERYRTEAWAAYERRIKL
ncbi:Orotidine 5'-phosphate decarboxylase [Tothia fuscella]|uniref:Orotidine 5'-phosphate decarboxylase n=1 Tax=Tothia fuscella TaxID=1048955 RepID=A0A9P4NSM4_9PEZI|nr:Orotidine 5'-phosphate decarboxylase [Tothia fuscella]